jgi:hypothetical protein
MKASQAIDTLKPEQWPATSIKDRIRLLKEVRNNLKTYGDDLAKVDAKMKNSLMGEEIFDIAESKVATTVPIANTLSAAIELYQSLSRGHMPKPVSIEKGSNNTHKIQVFPQSAKERIMAGSQKAYIHVNGDPKQINPMDKPAGIIGVLGAGNYSSSLEMVKAMFFDNCAVVHKPHHLNDETDKIWEKVFQPLIEVGAIAFCEADQGKELTQDPRLSKIYFTGGTATAQAIMSATDTPLISECGGNNPCLVVPGDRAWTDKEIEHQAIQIVTVAKMNGGAVCGRPQTIVTSKHWPQRDQFLTALKKAIKTDTPAAGTYYPGSDKVWEGFLNAYPDAEIIEPENGKYQNGKFMVILDASEDDYAIKNEAFCQIIDEVPLYVPANAEAFLPRAVEFCNEKLLGTLGACILIDEDTKKDNQSILDEAVDNMHYGGITVNNMPPFVFLSPYLTWGGNETRPSQSFVSGHGNFGNLLGFANIEKSVIIDSFMSPGHFMNTNKAVFATLANGMAVYAVEPTWMNIFKLMFGAISGGFKKKDF